MTEIKANSNLHTLKTGKPVFGTGDSRMAEYRRRWKEYPENFIVGGFPIHLDVESTNICNLRCVFCATSYNKYEKYGKMEMGLFRRVVDEGVDNGLCSIKLNCRGEPLLNPDLASMVGYAKSRGILDVFFNTNATLLTAARATELIQAGLDRIIISFEGFSKELYEKTRRGAVFEETLENIRNFHAERRRLGSETPKIRLQTVLIPEMVGKTDEYIAFFEKYADEITCVDMRDETGGCSALEEPVQWSCAMLWQRMTVHWDGTLVPCIHDVRAARAFGNVADISIRDAWLGARESRLRELHRAARSHEVDICIACPHRITETGKLRRRKT